MAPGGFTALHRQHAEHLTAVVQFAKHLWCALIAVPESGGGGGGGGGTNSDGPSDRWRTIILLHDHDGLA